MRLTTSLLTVALMIMMCIAAFLGNEYYFAQRDVTRLQRQNDELHCENSSLKLDLSKARRNTKEAQQSYERIQEELSYQHGKWSREEAQWQAYYATRTREDEQDRIAVAESDAFREGCANIDRRVIARLDGINQDQYRAMMELYAQIERHIREKGELQEQLAARQFPRDY